MEFVGGWGTKARDGVTGQRKTSGDNTARHMPSRVLFGLLSRSTSIDRNLMGETLHFTSFSSR